jgi:hypothetical protein
VWDCGWGNHILTLAARILTGPHAGRWLMKAEGSNFWFVFEDTGPNQQPRFLTFGAPLPGQPHFPWFFTVEPD